MLSRHFRHARASTRLTMAQGKTRRPYRVSTSVIHGRGVFAARTIRKGAMIVEYRGQRTTWEIASARPNSDPLNPQHTFIFETSDGKVIDGGRRGNAARWINHSCAPNCRSFEDDDGRVFIEACRTIPAGDEITYDYRLTLDGRITRKVRADYACRCGAPRCRGTLLLLR
jgi:SET domain-containing protein